MVVAVKLCTVEGEGASVTDQQKLDDASSSSATEFSSSNDSDSEREDNKSTDTHTFSAGSTLGLRRRHNHVAESDAGAVVKDTTKYTKNTEASARPVSEPPAFTMRNWIEFFIGSAIFFFPIPLVICQIVACTVWEFVDQATFKLTNLGTRFNEWCDPYYKNLVHHPKDTFIVNTTIWLGLCLPAYFCLEAYAQYQSLAAGNGFIWWRAAIYNVVRIGPMYRHFMFVYVLCHKEAHMYGKLFSEPHRTWLGLQFVYNYYIGFFHGVLPGPFTESHIYNHHKYDNAIDDVYSTGAFPRDNFRNFLHYVYIWFLYALNLSSIYKFFEEGRKERAYRCIGGVIYYMAGLVLTWKLVNAQFALVYVLYPLIEANILLSAVNYTWHAFIDPDDHDNDYVNSVTILDGLNFTLDEEYHVVHHQYGGVHWSRNKELYYKHIGEYKKATGTVFQKCNLFVIWGMIVAKDYEGLAEHFVQYEEDESKQLSKKEVANLLKRRLNATTWSY